MSDTSNGPDSGQTQQVIQPARPWQRPKQQAPLAEPPVSTHFTLSRQLVKRIRMCGAARNDVAEKAITRYLDELDQVKSERGL